MGDQRRKGCPQCGSKRFKFGQTTEPLMPTGLASMIPVRSRVCKKCGTEYYPVLPKIVPYALMLGGVVLILIALMAFFEPLMGKGSTQFVWWVKYGLIAAGLCFFGAGFQVFRQMKR